MRIHSENDKPPKQAAYEDLRRAVLLQEIPPGTPLEEPELCARYGISRTPMREVIQQLGGEGFLSLKPHRGARVSDMSHKTLRDFFLAAPMIYGAVLRLAAQNATPAQVSDLKDAQTAFRASLATGDTSDRTLANDRFHRITGEMADNRYLLSSFHRLLIDHARIGMTFFGGRTASRMTNLQTAADQHDSMIRAIEDGDEASAGALAMAHWNLSRHQIEAFAMPDGLEASLETPNHETTHRGMR